MILLWALLAGYTAGYAVTYTFGVVIFALTLIAGVARGTLQFIVGFRNEWRALHPNSRR
jgi:hypothetical protein